MKRTLTYASLLTGLCITLAVMTLLVSGCSQVASALNIQNPRYSIHDIRPRVDIAIPLSASTIALDFRLGVDNPNGVALRMDRLDFDVLVNGNEVVRSTSQEQVRIPSRGYGEVELRTRFGYDSVRTIFREVADMIQGERARYEVRGTAFYDTPVGQMRFPVTVFASGRNENRR